MQINPRPNIVIVTRFVRFVICFVRVLSTRIWAGCAVGFIEGSIECSIRTVCVSVLRSGFRAGLKAFMTNKTVL